MIDKLATEILIRIFSYLSNHQKRECLLTCQHWKFVLESSVLQARVYLTEQSIQRYLEEAPMTQTRTLILDQCCLSPKQLAQLPSAFPHLEHLVLCDGDPDVLTITAHERNNNKAETTWCQSLISIIESTDYMYSLFLLENMTFQQLSHLSLAFRYSDHVTQKAHFFQALRNSPIETLELECIVLSLEEMEMLHDNTPRLRHLTLADSTLIARQQSVYRIMDPTTYTLLADRSPASELRSVALTKKCRFYQSETYWIHYMAQKYPQLESLVLDCLHPSRGRELLSWTIRMRTSFLAILEHCPSFHSFFIKSVQLNREFIHAWRPNSLQRINWIVPDDQSTLPALSQTEQKHIKAIHLCLNRLFSHASILSHLQFISKILVHVKEIHLEGFPEMHEMLHILHYFPALETLILENIASVRFTSKDVVKDERFNLTSITLVSCGFDDQLFENISKYCPSIRKVKVMDCRGDLKRFSMPFSNLHDLNIKILDSDHHSTDDDSDEQQEENERQQEEAYFDIKTSTLEKTFTVQFMYSYFIFGQDGTSISKHKQKCIKSIFETTERKHDNSYSIYCKHILNLVINHTVVI